ncbi:4Fe-4S binding protein [Hyunsoonleella aestuarii]|uniref:Pyruvate:ferredoxin (Flavodoxin) oxidoreductase n=1 Tax=Hyunsoonleella aestuarii TaxID=912802 RepID=A0ABP8EBA1_9FLAO|nr:4Fe-4S binding protein [Hyunsoonleella aestuarii]
MKTSKFKVLTANEAVAHIAYKTNEVFPIYPITPASEMSELVEQFSAENVSNCFGDLPSVFQMQSEAGVAGAMHGSLQTGSLSSTFTASQGLLLMLPNMYKIAGELTPNVIHVATRSIATHALSIFGDHSDIMAVRQSGYAMLSSASVQEAQDFALIAQTATLESQIPFVHFFDGFRTSHELSKIETVSDSTIQFMMDSKDILKHKKRALNPNKPVLRGTAQGPDVFFESREALNPFYDNCPDIVQKHMNLFATLTGRQYNLFEYKGQPDAEQLIISMASSTETIEETILQLNKQGEKFGLIKVRLFRPFSTKHLIEALPESIKSIAVLDRTKEPGSSGEPLYLDILHSITKAFYNNQISVFPKIVGGRYGLSSKEFTPNMVQAIFNNLKLEFPKNNFTIGINDDVKNLSLNYSENVKLQNNTYQAIFYQDKKENSSKSFKKTLKQIGSNFNTFVQGYTQLNYKKSNSYNVAHLRISNKPVKAPYLIKQADFIGCQNALFAQNDSTINNLKPGGTLLVNTSLTSKAFWQSLSANKQYQIIEKNINLLIANFEEIKENNVLNSNSISELHAFFLANKRDISVDDLYTNLNDFIYSVDTSYGYAKKSIVSEFENNYVNNLLGKMIISTPVSSLPVDGTYPTNTSKHGTPKINEFIPQWNTDLCTQCGACSMACPQGALRIKAYDDIKLNEAPETLKHIPSIDFDLLNYTVQINPRQCNGCNNCMDACPVKALKQVKKDSVLKEEISNWTYFESIPEFDRTKIDSLKISQQQLQEPLFKYSSGVEGCGEAPYLKLMSQLFGDRMLVANATGASSIFGGTLSTTPWSQNENGQGPAWSNSLFEDNAEFGLGFRVSINKQEQKAKQLLKSLLPELNFDLAHSILNNKQSSEIEINKQRLQIEILKEQLKKINSYLAKQLLAVVDNLIKKSVWIVGGDGWAYDIGYGGLDHVLASGENVNILVLDNEVYDNTGAQASKATPFGATASFASNGKQKQKKDLGLLAMTYDNIYVASVAIGADHNQTLKAFNEAESFDGPSIIIAYCHSDSHGIDMKNPSQYHKAAVDSGQWLLYRNDPRRSEKGLNTLQLDSNAPTLKIEDYLKLEKRFSKIFKPYKEACDNRILKVQKTVDIRYYKYLKLSSESPLNRVKLIWNKEITQQLTFNK